MRNFALACLLLLPSQSATAAPRKSVVHRLATAAHNPTGSEYASAVQTIHSCAQFLENFANLPTANRTLTDMQSNHFEEFMSGNGPQKNEYETTENFQIRKKLFWNTNLGNPDKIFLNIKFKPENISYDADNGMALVGGPFVMNDGNLFNHMLIKEEYLTSKRYNAQNSFGASVSVERIHVSSKVIELVDDSQFGFFGGVEDNQKWRIAMNSSDARAFKSNAHLIVWVKLVEPYYRRVSDIQKATFDDPTEFFKDKEVWLGSVRCAAISAGAKVVGKLVDRFP